MNIEILNKVKTIIDAVRTIELRGRTVKDVWLNQPKDWMPPQAFLDAQNGDCFVLVDVVSMEPQYEDVQDYAVVMQWYRLELYILRRGTDVSTRERLELVEDFLKQFEDVSVNWDFHCLVTDSILFYADTPEHEKDLDTIMIQIPLKVRLEALRNP